MTQQETADDIFYNRLGLDYDDATAITHTALKHSDDGELFLEYRVSENLTFDDGQLKNASSDTSQGFGLRAIIGEASAYSYHSSITLDHLNEAAKTVATIQNNSTSKQDSGLVIPTLSDALYYADNPLLSKNYSEKISLLKTIDGYIRTRDNRVKQVSVSLGGEWQVVDIIRTDGRHSDVRPLVRLNVSVITEQDGRMERGSYGFGGRTSYDHFFIEDEWQAAADEALRQSLVNLESAPVKAGEMDVVLGPGWPGVLLHEAVGHGLEGDFNRKKTSAFAGLIGQQVAAKGVTVVDDGTIPDRRGSITIDDEGTPPQNTTLIEDGILVGYMQDRMNARLMGVPATGNGRRESYAHQPMPRMTNTYMLAGNDNPSDMIADVKDGIYATNFGGGQVDITSGKFVFSCTEAYKIENGKVTAPVKGATLIGNGPDCLKQVRAIGNDLELDKGVGTCGKDGQSVPVGVGQPSMLISNMTVGGTEV